MPSSADDRQFWESSSDQWLEHFAADGVDPWATEFNLPAFLELIPAPTGLTLDVGCGEGRVARLLSSRGHTVVGLDGAPKLARSAAQHGLPTVVGDGAHLPFADARAQLTISSMVLMDIDDLDAHARELARVTAPGGLLCASMLHPIRMAGFPLGDEHYTFALGDYLRPKLQKWQNERDGQQIRLRFWQRPIADYINALSGAGFDIQQVCEPSPSEAFVAEHDAEAWRRVPMFLHIQARRRTADAH